MPFVSAVHHSAKMRVGRAVGGESRPQDSGATTDRCASSALASRWDGGMRCAFTPHVAASLKPAHGRAMARCNMDTLNPDVPTARGPLPAYRALFVAGELAPDPSQALAAGRLQALWVRLRGYDPPLRQANGNGLLARLLRRRPTDEMDQSGANGLYLVG